MSRNRILAIGVLLWTVVTVDAVAHLVVGDWMAVALMGIVGVVCTGWILLRRGRASLSEEA